MSCNALRAHATQIDPSAAFWGFDVDEEEFTGRFAVLVEVPQRAVCAAHAQMCQVRRCTPKGAK